MEKINVKLGIGLLLSMILLLAGAGLVLCALLWYVIADSSYKMLCLYGGAAVAVVSFVCVIIFAILINSSHSNINKQSAVKNNAQQQEVITVDQNKINYIPSSNAFDFINLGNVQSVEDKFGQIALMGKTQFVIYIAKLFSLKGYQVRLTTVVDNRGIDMLVEKKNVIIAVGCIKSDRVLSADDIVDIQEGLKYYNAHSAMALTNTYFDRSALEYAKANTMSLVDRTILVEDFF